MRPRIVALLSAHIGPLSSLVPGYAVMLVLGCLVGSVYIVGETARGGTKRSVAISALLAAYIGGLLGAMAVPGVQAVVAWVRTGHLQAPTGMAAYGGLIGGSLATMWVLRRAHEPILPFFDVGCPALGIGYFFARIGCFLAGCDYGKPTSAVFGVHFPAGSHAHRDQIVAGILQPSAHQSLPVHPTQLYLAFAGLLLFFVVRRLPIDTRHPGRRFVAYVLGYAVLRSTIELFRGDGSRGSWGLLSTSQILALLTVVATFVTWRLRKARLHT